MTAKCRHICRLEMTVTAFCRRTLGIDHDGRIAVIIEPAHDLDGTFAVTHGWHQK